MTEHGEEVVALVLAVGYPATIGLARGVLDFAAPKGWDNFARWAGAVFWPALSLIGVGRLLVGGPRWLVGRVIRRSPVPLPPARVVKQEEERLGYY